MATLQERLAEYEELFADRYTEKDECYQKHVTTPVKPPPVVTDWNTNNYDRYNKLKTIHICQYVTLLQHVLRICWGQIVNRFLLG